MQILEPKPNLAASKVENYVSSLGSVEWTFLNVTYKDFEDEYSADVIEDDVPSDPECQQLRLIDSPSSGVRTVTGKNPVALLLENIPSTLYRGIDSHLLNYYIYELCPNCSLSSIQNPYLSVLLPIAYQFEPLRNAVLAAAANQLRLLNHHRFEAHALSLKSATIRALRQHLVTETVDWKSLATILMLCFYDVGHRQCLSISTH